MKKWIAIDLLLLLVAGLLCWQLQVSIRRFKVENDLAKVQPVRDMRQKIVPEKMLPQLPAAKVYSVAEFAIIPEKSVFSESRARDEKADSTATPEPPPLTQKPVLVGVTITGNQQMASIIDPLSSTQMQNRRAQTKRIGDVYQGYTITSIDPDRIVLESGTRKEIIPLHEGSKHPPGGRTPILSTRIVPIGGGGISGGTPVAVVSGGSAQRTAQAPAPVSAIAGIGQSANTQSSQSAGRSSAASARQVQGNTPSQPQQRPLNFNETINDQGKRVVHTPFGDIVQPNP